MKPESGHNKMLNWSFSTPEAEPVQEVPVPEKPQPLDDDPWAGLPSFGERTKKSKRKGKVVSAE